MGWVEVKSYPPKTQNTKLGCTLNFVSKVLFANQGYQFKKEAGDLRKIVSVIFVVLLVSGLSIFAFNVQPAKAVSGEIIINPNGTISSPVTANITISNNETYTFTGNNYLPIVVNRSNIIINGRGYTLQASEGIGFTLLNVGNVTIKSTTITNSSYGIYLDYSDNNTLSGNNITANTYDGVDLWYSSNNNALSGNNITANTYDGVDLWYSSNNNTLSGNNITANGSDGVDLWYSSNNNTLSGNNIRADGYGGIYLYSSCDNNTLSGNNVANSDEGIYLYSSCDNNTLSSNTVTANTYDGIWLNSSSGNALSGNNVANSEEGIYLNSSSDITLSGNNVTASSIAGIWLESSSGDVLSGNNITANNYDGIWLESSSGNVLSGNDITANSEDGIWLNSSSDVTLSGNNVTANLFGVELDYSSGNVLSGNNVTANSACGILLRYGSSGNVLSGNNVTADGYGVDLYGSSGNVLSGNNITANSEQGVDLVSSSNNTFFHNNFINNTQQAFSDGSPNTWDNGYPSGGNYWSNYQTAYPSAAENDSSAIWNTPYVIYANNTDYYPLAAPFRSFNVVWSNQTYFIGTVSNSTLSNFTFNATTKTLTFNATGATSPLGFCRITIPASLMSGGWTVTVNGTVITPNIILSENYTYIYFTYSPGTEIVQITSTNAVPEFRPFVLLPLFMIITLLGAIILKSKRRNLYHQGKTA